MHINDRYEVPEQFIVKEDRPDAPDQCPICKGTGALRHDWINPEDKIVNGYKLLKGVNIQFTPCECMESDAAAVLRVRPVQFTVEYEPPPPSVIYGKCRKCREHGEIDSQGYCYNC
jgi:hypothetical protein